MATIPSNSIAALSQIKVPAMKPAAAKAAPPPPPPPKPEVLATNANGVVAGKGRVVIDIEAPDSGYSKIIYYSTDNFKTRQYVGIDNETGTVDVGSFKPGTTIQFGIDNGQGDLFRTRGKAANSDKVDHTKVSKLADGGVRVGFEDLRGGGDRDFNDAIIKVRSVPVEAATPTAPAIRPSRARLRPTATARAWATAPIPARAPAAPIRPTRARSIPAACAKLHTKKKAGTRKRGACFFFAVRISVPTPHPPRTAPSC
jgi:hypothetical protein